MITLTTDFGTDSPYVAAMKGVILNLNPAARLLDLSHQIPPQDVRYAAYFLATAIPYFPPSVLHVAVVDPGVGSERAILHVEVAGHRLLVPDNGCWTELPRQIGATPTVHRLTERRFWRDTVSATFHGRDIFAPVAAHLSLGIQPAELGPPITQWVVLEPLPLVIEAKRVQGAVEFIDHFGNLITNIPSAALPAGPLRIMVGKAEAARRVRTYAEAPAGEVVALVASNDRLEIAVNHGSAAARLGARAGALVSVESVQK